MDELQALPPARDFVEAERDTAREQLTAAWQLHVERLQEQIERGWQEVSSASSKSASPPSAPGSMRKSKHAPPPRWPNSPSAPAPPPSAS
ncbi:MAG: hypothetical protein QM757_02185 [Paludibaculum sp.]